MIKRLSVSLILLPIILGHAAHADRRTRLIARVTERTCPTLFRVEALDFTRRSVAPRNGNVREWLAYLKDRAQTRHDRREWSTTQLEIVDVWDGLVARRAAESAWVDDYAFARAELNRRARRFLALESRNPAEVRAAFARFEGLLTELARDNAEVIKHRTSAGLERLPIDANVPAVLAALSRVAPPAGPKPPPDLVAELKVDREWRRWLIREIQLLRRLPLARARTRLEINYALFESGFDPVGLGEIWRGLRTLGIAGAAARWRLLEDLVHAPFLGHVIRRASGIGEPRARLAFFIYLANLHPAWLPDPNVRMRVLRAGERFAGLDDAQDFEQVITDVILRTGESPNLRAALKATLILMPEIMHPDAALPPRLKSDEEALASAAEVVRVGR